MACALQYAAGFRHEREDMPWLTNVFGCGVVCHRLKDRMRALRGTDTGADLLGGVDRHGEIGLMLGAVIAHHQRQVELPCALWSDRHADQAAGFGGKEINDLRRGLLGGNDQVAFILTVLIIHQDDHSAGADVIE